MPSMLCSHERLEMFTLTGNRLPPPAESFTQLEPEAISNMVVVLYSIFFRVLKGSSMYGSSLFLKTDTTRLVLNDSIVRLLPASSPQPSKDSLLVMLVTVRAASNSVVYVAWAWEWSGWATNARHMKAAAR